MRFWHDIYLCDNIFLFAGRTTSSCTLVINVCGENLFGRISLHKWTFLIKPHNNQTVTIITSSHQPEKISFLGKKSINIYARLKKFSPHTPIPQSHEISEENKNRSLSPGSFDGAGLVALMEVIDNQGRSWDLAPFI